MRFIVADNFKMSLKVKSEGFASSHFNLSHYHTNRKCVCEISMRKKDNLFMLQERKIDHRQHARIHYKLM